MPGIGESNNGRKMFAFEKVAVRDGVVVTETERVSGLGPATDEVMEHLTKNGNTGVIFLNNR